MNHLYISDLDGTLLNNNQTVSQESVAILNGLINQGLQFTIATARSFDSAFKLLEEIQFKLPLVFMNGIFIYDPKTKRNIQSHFLAPQLAADVINTYEQDGLNPIVYTLDHELRPHVYFKGIFNASEDNYISSRVSKGDPRFKRVTNYEASLEESIIMVNAIEAPERLIAAYEKFNGHPGMMVHYGADIYSPGYHWLEIGDRKANKRDAVLFLKEYLQAERLICFGDHLNDLGMFEAADEKYAVANAHHDIIKASTALLLSNEEHGVAAYLKSRFQKEENL
ncbi:phosphatase [Paenibacillus baekrokdamisoli]|uniref:Phosphatase n=1 Tax=Paenibacillus baekrokdamisoli TaxID=1712516 RepID=A0A3G9IKC3_9BACL|nr:phosphatase [Paenibacillus baekrokdamisoli]